MPVDSETLKAMLKDPSKHFARPQDVLSNTELDAEQKKAVLQSWLVDEQELARATDENMGASNSNSNNLAAVTDALETLDGQ